MLPGIGIDIPSKLGGDHHPITKRREGFPDQLFVRKWAVGLGGIEERDALFNRRLDERDSMLLIDCRTITDAQAHAS
jgi:hypothetical protein